MDGNDGGKKPEVLPGFPTVQDFSADGFKRVVNGVKAFQALPPPGPSWDLNKSYPEFSKSMKSARSKILPMMVSLLRHVNMPTSDFKSRDVDEKFEFLVECNDDLMERIGSSLDEAEGLFTKSEMVVVDKAIAVSAVKPPGAWGKRKIDALNHEADDDSIDKKKQHITNRPMKKPNFRLRVAEKPQLKFSKPIDNSLDPFVPKLKEKPHSIKPLSILPEYNLKNEEFFGHPYSVELNKWEPSNELLVVVEPQNPKSLKDTPVVFVNNIKGLEELMKDLLNVKGIGVDLEHHSYRTFLGLTCLIQISTRDKDYVIDGLSLREDLYHLNEILADPKVLKVFHGSSSDIEWLQRDFGLYIVNMFDTYIAAKTLGHPQLSLQYLLGRYCDVSQNKSYQLADWRIRPLPNDMLEYARQDTHYLLYIYERMKNELIEAGNQHNNLLTSVFDQSRSLCLKRYEKPGSNPQLALRKTRRSLNNRQLYAFSEIYKWRDGIAREKDESLGFVLPNHMLLTIAETLPKEMNGILACCDPVPPLIHANLGKIHKIVTTARELPLQTENAEKNKVEKKQKLKNWVIAVNSIHDVNPVESSEVNTIAVCDNDDDISSKPPHDAANTVSWPQPWVDPGGWKSLVRNDGASLKFNNKVSFMRYRNVPTKSSELYGVTVSDSLTTPYGRYEISKNIMEILKDPKKQGQVDMQDPLVKAVYEAVLVDEEDTVEDYQEELPKKKLSEVLNSGDFVPFNPLAESGSARKKKKDLKNEPWNDNKPEVKEERKPVGLGLEEDDIMIMETSNQDDADAQPMPILKASKQKRNKRKGKLMHRLKNAFSRNKKDATSQDDSVEIVDLEDDNEETPPTDRNDSEISQPAKRFKRGDQRQQQNKKGNWKHPSNAQMDPSPSRKEFHRPDRKSNKAGIFKAWKRDNRSITFKK
ncbi:Exosome component 10 [Orchesella cincta]|uniref:Exosome complex component 10 homolog n=1 Tax=Orchesella cincta TaxID=48709 RepID=A0A1D2N2R0_ORCCI|nr:Exosome component 10 [Orchesella cincta]